MNNTKQMRYIVTMSPVAVVGLTAVNPLMAKTAEQRTIIGLQQYGDWYTGRWWVGYYIRYSEEGPGRGRSPLTTLLAVPTVIAHLSMDIVPTAYYSSVEIVSEKNKFDSSLDDIHIT